MAHTTEYRTVVSTKCAKARSNARHLLLLSGFSLYPGSSNAVSQECCFTHRGRSLHVKATPCFDNGLPFVTFGGSAILASRAALMRACRSARARFRANAARSPLLPQQRRPTSCASFASLGQITFQHECDKVVHQFTLPLRLHPRVVPPIAALQMTVHKARDACSIVSLVQRNGCHLCPSLPTL